MGIDWRADPRIGAAIGAMFLFFFLVGPVALVIPVITWIVIKRRASSGAGAGGAERRARRRPPQRPNLG